MEEVTRPGRPNLSARQLEIARAPLCALLRWDHPLAGAAALSADDLREQTVLLFEHSGPHSAAIDNFFGGCHYMAGTTYIRVSDAAVGLAAEGLGIALVDGFTAMDWLPPGLVRLPLVNAPEFQARLYWNRERPGSKFVDLLHKTLTTLTTET